jgi:hypothetical protein
VEAELLRSKDGKRDAFLRGFTFGHALAIVCLPRRSSARARPAPVPAAGGWSSMSTLARRYLRDAFRANARDELEFEGPGA